MKEGDLIMDGDGKVGVVTSIVLAYVPMKDCPLLDGNSVAMAYFFESKEIDIVYIDEITVITKGDKSVKHILERE
jgi:hypothetical protein|tara:strand:+ start:576 stop:800 length:225 start_codon:yes stop_codon:yes gene_type:complete